MTKKHQQKHLIQWILVGLFLAGNSFLLNINLIDFQANVIPLRQPPPFDGMVMPVQEVPDWVTLSSDLWNANHDQIPADQWIPIPAYIPSILEVPLQELNWNNENDKVVFNTKITYTVPYMGNYLFDGIEYAGSHLGIDIKLPIGTPLYAIANGTVAKVVTGNVGFGNHIVVKHENVPSFNDSALMATYYSSYSHLSSSLVAEGDILLKGQQIGLSGQSGAATIAHLHFQIDNDQAQWHPYWPFTHEESVTAGYNVTESVNVGLGKEKALLATINPLLYVQKYATGTAVASASSSLRASSQVVDILRTAADAGEPPFKDVSPTGPAVKALRFLKINGMISGFPDGSFRPKKLLVKGEAKALIVKSSMDKSLSITRIAQPFKRVTRAEFLKMLLAAMNIKPSAPSGNVMPDVSKTAWYAPYVAYALEHNLIEIRNNHFRPERFITREEAAQITYRTILLKQSSKALLTTARP